MLYQGEPPETLLHPRSEPWVTGEARGVTPREDLGVDIVRNVESVVRTVITKKISYFLFPLFLLTRDIKSTF